MLAATNAEIGPAAVWGAICTTIGIVGTAAFAWWKNRDDHKAKAQSDGNTALAAIIATRDGEVTQLRAARDADKQNFDKWRDDVNAKLYSLATQVGDLGARVQFLERRNTELEALAAEKTAEIAQLRVEIAAKDLLDQQKSARITQLLADLDIAQSEKEDIADELAALKATHAKTDSNKLIG